MQKELTTPVIEIFYKSSIRERRKRKDAAVLCMARTGRNKAGGEE